MYPNEILTHTIIAEREREERQLRLAAIARCADGCRRAASRLSRFLRNTGRLTAGARRLFGPSQPECSTCGAAR